MTSRRRPFLIRLILPFFAMIVLVIAACGGVTYYAGLQRTRSQQVHDLDRLVGVVRGAIGGAEIERTSISDETAARLKDLATALDARITLITSDGHVLFDTHHDAATMELHNDRPEIRAARGDARFGSSVRWSETIGQNAVYVARPLDRAAPEGTVVRLSFPERVWAKLPVPVWAILLGAAVSAALLTLGLALALQRRWIGPVRELADAAEQMASGQWQTRVNPDGDDEVHALGTRFNVMASHAQKQVAELNHQRADLQALVDSLPDPVLLSDENERIIVINTPAARLLQLTPPQALGKKLGVVVNEQAILNVVEQVYGATDSAPPGGTITPAPATREVRLVRKGQKITYHAVATRAKAGGVLLVLRNVSAMAATVQMKTDFVANASHELRTPLAAIKAAFETLQDVYADDPTQTAKCVSIIDGQLRRLEEMLTDLLDLSRVESPDLKAQIAPVRVADVISFVRSLMEPAARLKGVELAFDTKDWGANPEFESDQRLLNLILRNLVENSIKFTPASGRITTRFERRAGQITISVVDTGIGIPPEHLERVFERFYQVDPARSGSAGRGTGLGLAIVKHAVNALGGQVELSSTVGRGTTVICTLADAAVVES